LVHGLCRAAEEGHTPAYSASGSPWFHFSPLACARCYERDADHCIHHAVFQPTRFREMLHHRAQNGVITPDVSTHSLTRDVTTEQRLHWCEVRSFNPLAYARCYGVRKFDYASTHSLTRDVAVFGNSTMLQPTRLRGVLPVMAHRPSRPVPTFQPTRFREMTRYRMARSNTSFMFQPTRLREMILRGIVGPGLRDFVSTHSLARDDTSTYSYVAHM
jgi:hypothetical protein